MQAETSAQWIDKLARQKSKEDIAEILNHCPVKLLEFKAALEEDAVTTHGWAEQTRCDVTALYYAVCKDWQAASANDKSIGKTLCNETQIYSGRFQKMLKTGSAKFRRMWDAMKDASTGVYFFTCLGCLGVKREPKVKFDF